MTNQTVFNRVTKHLLKQGVKSKLGGSCRYRGPNDTKCAIGCLIPDYLYKPGLEGASAFLLMDFPKIKRHFAAVSFGLLSDLQNCHDWEEVEYWPERLRVIANKFKLTIPKVLITQDK